MWIYSIRFEHKQLIKVKINEMYDVPTDMNLGLIGNGYR